MRKFYTLLLVLFYTLCSIAQEPTWSYVVQSEDYDATSGGWVEESSDLDYTGSGYMKCTDNGSIDYNVNFPAAGTYYLYLRQKAADAYSNGVHLDVDGVSISAQSPYVGIYCIKTNVWNYASQFQEAGEGNHCGPVKFSIATAGEHTVTLKRREVNYKVDKLVFLSKAFSLTESYCGTSEPVSLKNLSTLPTGYFSEIPKYTLLVLNGSNSGSYEEGTVITLIADDPPAGKIFYKWIGNTSNIESIISPTTSITMPATDVTISALYNALPNVINDTEGQSIKVYPNPASNRLVISNIAPYTEIQILNLSGQLVNSYQIRTNEITLDIQDFNTGLYILRFTNEQNLKLARFLKL